MDTYLEILYLPDHMDIKLRNANSKDLPTIERIAELAYSGLKCKVSDELWQRWLGGILDSINTKTGTLIVLENDEVIIGVVQFYENAAESRLDGWPSDYKAGALRVFAVLPEHQGKGYGKMLISESINRARKMCLKKLFLHTGYINQSAIHLFEQMGFMRAKEYDFYPYGQTDHLAIAYCLEL